MRHAHGVEITQQSRLKVSADIHKRQHVTLISPSKTGSATSQIFPRVARWTGFGDGGRQQSRKVAFQEENLYRHLGCQESVAISEEISQLAPAVRPWFTIKEAGQSRGKTAGPSSDARETLEPFPRGVSAKEFVAALA